MTKHVAYLINQYPKVSHTFIRTEILALERLGVSVERIAMRGWDAETVDPLDAEERGRTRYVLQGGALLLIGAVVAVALRRPVRLAAAVQRAWRLSRGGERGFLYHLIYVAEACLILRWLDGTGISHVHAHFGSNAATVALLVRVLGGPPYSFTAHGPEEFDKPFQWKLADKIAGAAFVVAITSYCRSQLFRWARPADWPKIGIVHCALDPRMTDAAAAPATDDSTLVCVGRLCEQKGQLLLVQAMAALRARGVAMRLVLAGDGEMRSDIEAAITAAGLTDRIRITGWVGTDEVRRLLDGATALVLPSFAEGLPVVIMEAMARARPVISTYIAGIPELVRDGREGLLVPAGDVEALTDAMEELAERPPHALATLGEAARSRVLARHSDMIEAAKLAALFRRSLEGRAEPSAETSTYAASPGTPGRA